MKAIDLSETSPTLADLLRFAGEDNVLLRTSEGREFILAEVDVFSEEVAKVSQNKALMRLLEERSVEKTTLSVSKVWERLGNKKSRK